MIPMLYDSIKKWVQNGSIWIISDTHFDDENCRLIDPNWITSEEQQYIIQNKVYKTDTLVHLGDVGNPKYLKDLNCYKVLIMGNHDQDHRGQFKNYFNEIYNGPLFIAPKIVLSHEPILFQPNFCINLHGHDHSGRYIDEYHMNFVANYINYTPVNLGKLIRDGLVSKVQDLHRIIIEGARN